MPGLFDVFLSILIVTVESIVFVLPYTVLTVLYDTVSKTVSKCWSHTADSSVSVKHDRIN